jgi:hypothetical protein
MNPDLPDESGRSNPENLFRIGGTAPTAPIYLGASSFAGANISSLKLNNNKNYFRFQYFFYIAE